MKIVLPRPALAPVCAPGEFPFAAVALDHGHIYGQCQGLIAAGGELRMVYEPDPAKLALFLEKFPGVQVARHLEEILQDEKIKLVTAAAVPSERAALGLQVLDAGKDYFTDKAPCTTLEQLAAIQAKVEETGRKYLVYFSERLHSEVSVLAGEFIAQGVIGEVMQVLGLGPHRLNAETRSEWFFRKKNYGGILCDLGSHQVEQFLFYTGATEATITQARTLNYAHPAYPELEDFGELSLVGNNRSSGYFRVDWFTPAGLNSWGDGRLFLQGTRGYMELRKYLDLTRTTAGNHLYLVNEEGEFHFPVEGQIGFPFFGQMISDCLHRTERAMTQAHIFKTTELCLRAQALADQASPSY